LSIQIDEEYMFRMNKDWLNSIEIFYDIRLKDGTYKISPIEILVLVFHFSLNSQNSG